jgi:hypothetical protein
MQWQNTHRDECPVTTGRRMLSDDLEQRPDDPYLLGAVPEWDRGGDEEAEACTCDAVPRCVDCATALVDWHPASRADGKVEGLCIDHGHVVAA